MSAAISLSAADPSGLFDQGVELLKTLSKSEIKVTIPTAEQMQGLWSSLSLSLNSDSIESVAALRPQAEMVLGYLDQVEAAKPYANWLRQRIDYLEVAEEVLRIEKQVVKPPVIAPQPQPPPPKPVGTNKPPKVVPVQPKPVVTPPPVVSKKTQQSRTARNSAVWQRRIAQHPMPANAVQLVPKLKKIFLEEGVPGQLVWLAEVESTMDPNAKSPAGAAGLFQMMKPAAQRFGLRVSPPPDERFDPEKQGRASAKYLRLLYGRFKSWPLALAAYNAGEGRIGKALSSSGGKTFDDIAPLLSVETQMYVPKIDAVLQKREGIALEKVGPAKS